MASVENCLSDFVFPNDSKVESRCPILLSQSIPEDVPRRPIETCMDHPCRPASIRTYFSNKLIEPSANSLQLLRYTINGPEMWYPRDQKGKVGDRRDIYRLRQQKAAFK